MAVPKPFKDRPVEFDPNDEEILPKVGDDDRGSHEQWKKDLIEVNEADLGEGGNDSERDNTLGQRLNGNAPTR